MEKQNLNLKDLLGNLSIISNLVDENIINIVKSVVNPFLVSKFGDISNIDVIANKNGDFQIIRTYEVVEDDQVTNPNLQIGISKAKEESDDFEVGEDFVETIGIDAFDKLEQARLSKNLWNKLYSYVNDYVKEKYSSLVGQLINLEVVKSTKAGFELRDSAGLEYQLNYKDTLHNDIIRVGDVLLVLVTEIGFPGKVTRISKKFMEELLDLELRPELDYTLMDMARNVGIKTKYSIKGKFDKNTYDTLKYVSNIISDKLNGESVDIVIYSTDRAKYLKNCFFNTWIMDAWFEDDKAFVLADKKQVPYVLGKKGTNIKLVNKLLDTNVQVLISTISSDEDIELREYLTPSNKALIKYLEGINVNTARGLMRLNREKLPNKFKSELSKLMTEIHTDFTEKGDESKVEVE